MALHLIRIIDDLGHHSTQRLFELGLSFGVCKRKRRWPSLETMNSFLRGGTDEGESGTTIEWEACELSQDEYKTAVSTFMRGEPFTMDTGDQPWDDWFTQISHDNAA
jgi:hypothetical protein